MWLLKCLLPLLLWCRLIGTETKFRRSNPYVADAVGNTLPAPSMLPSKVGSPSILLTPDRYEFYTFDETGELVKQLMTLDEIQAIVASDDENEGHMVTLAQTDLHKPAIAFNFSHPPPIKVHSVVTNVQNVLKSQIEAHKKNPPNPQHLDTPDVSASWSMILPSIFGNTGVDIVPDKLPNSFGTPETDTVEMVTKRESLDEMVSTEGNSMPAMKQTTKTTTVITDLLEDSLPSIHEVLQIINNDISKDRESSTIAAEIDVAVASSAATQITTIVNNHISSSTESSTRSGISNAPNIISSSSPALTIPTSTPTPITATVDNNILSSAESSTRAEISNAPNIISSPSPALTIPSSTLKPITTTVNNHILSSTESSTRAEISNAPNIISSPSPALTIPISTLKPITTTVDNNILRSTESSTRAQISNAPNIISSPSPSLSIPTSPPTPKLQTKVTLKTSTTPIPSLISTISSTTIKSVDSSQFQPNSSDDSNFVKISVSSNAVKSNATTEKVAIAKPTTEIEVMEHKINDTTENEATSNAIKEMTSTIINNEILNTENVPTTPTLQYSVEVSMTENPVQNQSTSPKSSSPSSVVETTTKPSLSSDLPNEVTDPKPVFNVAESISQIASDLGNQFKLPEIEQYDLEVKESMDAKLDTDESKEAEITTQLTVNDNIINQTSNNSNKNINLTKNTDVESDNFIKITTLEPNKLSNVTGVKNNESKIDNSTVSFEAAQNTTTVTQDTILVLANEETTLEPTLELVQSMNDLLSQVVQESPQPVIQISHLTDITTSESALNRNEDLELIATVQPVSQKLEATSTEIPSTTPGIPSTTILDILLPSTITSLAEGWTETTTLFTLFQTKADVTNPTELTESATEPTTEIITNSVNNSASEIESDTFIPIAKLNATLVTPSNEFATDHDKSVTTIPTTVYNEDTTLKTSTKWLSVPSTNFEISENDQITENVSEFNVIEFNDRTERVTTDTTEKTTSTDTMETVNKTLEISNQVISKNNTQQVVYSNENMAISNTKYNASIKSEIQNNNQINATMIEKGAESITKVNNSVTEVVQMKELYLSTKSSEPIATSTAISPVKVDDIKSNSTNDMDLSSPIMTEPIMKTSTITPTSSLIELYTNKEHNTEAMANVEVTTEKTNIIENTTKKIIESLESIPTSTSSSTVKIEDPKKKVQKVNIDSKEHMDHPINNTWTLISTLPPPKYVAGHQNEKNNTNIKRPPSNVIKTQTRPRPLNNEPSKHINLDGSKENQGLEATTKDLSEDVYQFSELCNELAFRYWNAIKESPEDNKRSLVFSPYAITSMLAMIFMGARGATSGEMNEILRLDDMVTFNPHFVLKNISDSIEVSMRAGVVASTFIRELYSDRTRGKLLTFYKERAQHFYGGLVEETNFKLINDIIRRRTNLLVKRNTWGKIAEYLKANTITMQPPLAAFSANIYETDCSTSSTEGRDGEMYFVVSPSVRQRRLVPIPSVVYKKGFLAGYDPVLDATAASIGTGDQVTSTIFLMPGQQGNAVHSEDLDILQKRIQAMSSISGAWNRLMRTLLPRLGLELQVPRFAHRSLLNISTTLQSMGLKDLFDAEKADLRGLSGLSNDLYISDMMQSNLFATCGEGTIAEQHHVESYPDEPARRRRSLWYSPSLSNAEYRWTEGWEEPRDYQRAFHDPHDLGVMYMPLHLRPRQARLPPTVAPEVARLKLDRPFLYFVRHNLSGMILYMGRFNPRLLP